MSGPGRSGQDTADVCVVGAGPVGLTLAHALAERDVRVVLLESGSGRGPRDPGEADDLLAGPTAQGGPGPLDACRSRGIGGSARIWNTLLAESSVAKYLPLRPLDLEDRSGFGGWPIDAAELARWIAPAARACGFDPGVLGPHPTALKDPGAGLESHFYGFGRRERFTDEIPSILWGVGHVTVHPGRTVDELLLTPAGDRIAGVAWIDDAGARGRVRAERVVLTAGAMESARLLLLPTARPAPWADLEWLGRGFMEHPVDRSCLLRSGPGGLDPDPYAPHRMSTGDGSVAWRMGVLTPVPERLRASGLPSMGVRIPPPDPPGLVRAMRGWRSLPARAVRKTVAHGVAGATRALRRVRGAPHRLVLDLEQWPDPANRVVLTPERDRTGRPRAELRWRWSPDDRDRHRRLRELLDDAFAEAGLGRLEVDPGVPLDPNAHHHAGTTRMHPDPRMGVVDPTLRVHGCDGLYVCGGSVFPTAGFANPTLTTVALALRLAEHLEPRPDALS